MKKSAALLFLTIFLVGLLGPYAYFAVRLRDIRREMRADLKNRPAHELEVLQMNAVDFKAALVGDDEVKVNGQMFDIAHIEKKGTEVFVYCLHDEDEDSLLTLIDGVLRNASRDKKGSPLPLAGFISTLGDSPSISNLFPHDNDASCTRYLRTLSDSFLAVIAPPPKVILLS